MTTTDDKLTLTLTDAPPVSIRRADWPVIASGDWSDHDGEVPSQANQTWGLHLRVRQHADGRALVTGRYTFDTHWPGRPNVDERRGELLGVGGDVIAAIRRVGADLGECHDAGAEHVREVVQECIGDLPSVELD